MEQNRRCDKEEHRENANMGGSFFFFFFLIWVVGFFFFVPTVIMKLSVRLHVALLYTDTDLIAKILAVNAIAIFIIKISVVEEMNN